jgi:hypothetical protein
LTAAPVKTYASAIALKELAIAAAAGAHPLPDYCHISIERSKVDARKVSQFEVEHARNHAGRNSMA